MSSASDLEIDELGTLPIGVLRDRFRVLYGSEAPVSLGKDLMIRAVAHRIQERGAGGASLRLQRRLNKLVRAYAETGQVRIDDELAVKPGTRLIRDKIAASKKKGMWMGGTVPLGYDIIDRKLVVNDAEAKTVRTLFRLYLEHGSVRRVREEAARLLLEPKRRAGGKDNISDCFGFGQLYYLLSNPTYTGKARHKNNTYPGERQAIIGQTLWEAVQAKLAANHKAHRSGANTREPGLLTGLLAEADGNWFSPNHAVKGGERYRYYVERSLTKGPRSNAKSGQRLPAGEIERTVIEALVTFLRNAGEVAEAAGGSTDHADQMVRTILKAISIASEVRDADHKRKRELLIAILRRVVVAESIIDLEVDVCGLKDLVGHNESEAADAIHVFRMPIEHRLHRGATRLILASSASSNQRHHDQVLIKAFVRAHDWWAKLLDGSAESISDLAASTGVSRSYVSRGVRLVFLAPDIVGAILNGTQPSQLSAKQVINGRPIPMNWPGQRREFRMTTLDA